MTSVYVSALLICCGVGAGVGLPWWRVRHDRTRQRQQDHLAELYRQEALVADYEATTTAYRQFVQSDPELTLTAR